MKYLSRILIAVLLMSTPLCAYIIQTILSADGKVTQLRWKTSAFPLTWQMNATQGGNVTGPRSQEAVFNAAFATWTGVSTASVSFTEGKPDASLKPQCDGVNTLTSSLTTADYKTLGLPTAALAFTLATTVTAPAPGVSTCAGTTGDFAGQILDADIVFNPNFPFTTDTAEVSGSYDIQSVATHEIGHLLGLDHAGQLMSATMFWTGSPGINLEKVLSADDMAGVTFLYPKSATVTQGSISGTIRTVGNVAVYGAIVVAVNSNGQPAGSAVTDPSGSYTIAGLPADSYTVYAQPLNGPMKPDNIYSLGRTFPSSTVNTGFTVRYH